MKQRMVVLGQQALARLRSAWQLQVSRRTVPVALAVAAAYYVGAQVGFMLRAPGLPLAIIWPPNAILLAALLLVPTRRWWVLLLAVLPAHLLVEAQNGYPPWTLLGLYVTNCSEALLAAVGIRRFTHGPPWFATVRQVAIYIVCAVVVAPFVTSFLDAAVVVLTHQDTSQHYGLLWQKRFVFHVLTYLTVPPVLLSGAGGGWRWLRTASRQRLLEAALLALSVLGAAYLVFRTPLDGASSLPALLYAPIPVLLWATFRFGVGGSSAALLGLTLLSALSQAQSAVFVTRSPAAEVLALQVFLIVVSAPTLFLAALVQEQRQTEAALRASEARAGAIVDATPDACVIVDGQGRIVRVNAQTELLFGYAREELLGQPVELLLPERFPDSHVRYRASYQAAPRPWPMGRGLDLYARRKDGGEVPVEVSLSPLQTAEGTLVISAVRDITERKRAEEALRASETRLRRALEIETVGVIFFQATGEITYANDAFLRMSGYTPEDHEQGLVRWDAMTPPEYMPQSLHAVEEFLATGHTTPYEKEYIRKDGSRWWALFAATHIDEAMGIEFIIDISERKQAEADLAAELEAMTRLHDLSQRVLAAPDLQTLLETVLEATMALHGADFGNIQLYDAQSRTLRIAAQRGFAPPFLEHFAQVSAKEGSACGRALSRGERIIIADVAQDPAYAPHLAVARDAGYRAVQSTPLLTTIGEPVGMLSTHFRQPRHFAARELRLTDLYARLASDALATRLLADSLREQAQLIELAHDAILVRDLEGRVVQWNQGAVEMYGWTVEEARAQATHTLLRTRFPVSPQEVERALEQCGRWEGELVHTRRDGAQIVVESRQVLLRDEAGQPTAILEINREITARKRAEDALRESEERLQALVHASSEVLYSMSPDWTEMRELSGGGFMADTQSPSRTWLGRYIHPDDQPRVTAAIQEAVRTKSVYELEHRVRRVDGSLGWALSRAVPRFGADDKITEWFGAASDVTARKAAEEALRAALAEQQALLREVNHRVKNNLAVINSLLRLQAADIDDARTRQALTEAASRVRAIGVVHRLLYDAPTLAPVDLGRFAEELAQALFASYGVSAERVRFALSGDQLGTDLERAVPVGLILNELVTNALKYAFPGERAGRVEVWIDAERGVLELFDDGVGLPPSVDLAHPRTLGLQLVQALVRQVGGTLQLLPGPGTHYQLQLPPVQACQAGGNSLSRRSSAS